MSLSAKHVKSNNMSHLTASFKAGKFHSSLCHDFRVV